MNNPLRYTDPSGEFLFAPIIIAAIVFGIANVAIQAANGEIKNVGDFVKGFAAGAVVGATVALGVTAGLGVPILGTIIKGAAIAYGASTAIGIVGGVAAGIDSGNWSRLGNSAKQFFGNFYLDSNRSLFGQAYQGMSRFSLELIQTTVGYAYSQIRNGTGGVSRVDFMGGATFSTGENFGRRRGVSLGNFLNIWIAGTITGEFEDYATNDPLFMHEYGHIRDSRIFGPLYLPVVGLPSALGACWTEARANRAAASYFDRKYGVDWSIVTAGRSTYSLRCG
jgi:hypothetical protein